MSFSWFFVFVIQLFLLVFYFHSVALLTIYDKVKAVDRGMIINEIKLLKKTRRKIGSLEKRLIRDEVHVLTISNIQKQLAEQQ